MSNARRQIAYSLALAAIIALTAIPSLDWLWDSPLTDLVKRNSEGFAIALLVVAYVDLVRHTRPTVMASWYALMLAAGIALQAEAFVWMPPGVTTLSEAFFAGFVIAAYIAWIPKGPAPHRQLIYYPAILIFTVVGVLAGGEVAAWLETNAEAAAAALLVPVYFDFVNPSLLTGVDGSRTSRGPLALRNRIVWYVVLIAVPVFVQTGVAVDLLGAALQTWLQRTTEGFLAAILVGFSFDVVSPGARPLHRSPAE